MIYTFRDKSKENIKTFEKNIITCDWTTIGSLNDPTEAYTSFSDNAFESKQGLRNSRFINHGLPMVF